MDFSINQEQSMIVDAIQRICDEFDDDYWLARDNDGEFPEEFFQKVSQSGWLGIAMPEEYGGANMGITEAALMMQTISQSGAGFSGASAIHMNIFGLNPVVRFGSKELKESALPPLIRGEQKACFGVTEPDAGLDTTKLTTFAKKVPGGYSVTGRKIWISTAQVADKILLLARTTPLSEVKKPTEGLSLFYTKLDKNKVEIREIDKLGRKAVDSNMLFFDEFWIDEADRVGEEGKGFEYLLHGLNPERILIAAEAVGLAKVALNKASQYAKDRVVFGRPIGMNQGIQHPLAQCWMQTEAAELMVLKAAVTYDENRPCGAYANAAKYLAAEAAFNSCQTAIQTLGGMGYAKEYHVERYLRESFIPRLAPVSPQLIMSYIAEKVLGLPKSY
ncbi:Acyl-CoA dehydrogenase fadE12 [Oligella ureolytica]|uniref:acyl-CoA dehydrogenase family protein n=1 Tax=Oligella ureolytica TaxID=90244 RepID=UPI000E010792|nr:acyl-CoA dehydrogenase family protein [Oligella ureolytica]SUA57046.1 Acyl-CoA dehydrogenase fadE12 [Oligella ureolytica]HZJ96718.1 acyl-CoA dehydrogenase family protein [Oligella sp.]